jgi:hypothetical protein
LTILEVSEIVRSVSRPARLVGIVCAWFAVVSSAGGAVAVQPPYYFNKGAGFEIYSNRDWHGVGGTAGVREVGEYSNHTPRDPDRSFRIWTPKCTPGQIFSVARSVDFLGPPSSVSFSFAPTMDVASTAVLVNGHPAAKSVGNNSPSDLTSSQLALFHPGANELTVMLTLQKTPNVCTSGGVRPSVWFEINGYFSADLTVGAPRQGQSTTYFKADGGRTVTTHIHLTNDGPDLIPDATVMVQMGGPGFCVKPNPDGSCDPGNSQFTMTGTELLGGIKCTTQRFLIAMCAVTNLKPNETRFVTVIMRYVPDPTDPSWTDESMSLTWTAKIADGGPADTNSSNDQASVTYVFCSTRSTMPGCKTAQ